MAIKGFLKKAFIGNVSILMLGTFVSQLIPIASAPILTRLYTPDEFGVLALFLSIGSILSVFANFKFDAAIMSAKNKKEEYLLKHLSLVTTLLFSILLLLVTILFHESIVNLVKLEDLNYYIFILPLFVLFVGLFQLYTYTANKEGKYKSIAYSKINKNLSMTLIQLIFGFFAKGSFGLIIGTLSGFLLGLLNIVPRKRVLENKHKYDFDTYKETIKAYKEFPLLSTGSAFIDKLSVEMPTIFLSNFYTSLQVGYFDLIRRTIAGPLSIISYSISQVYFKKVVEYRDSNQSPFNLTIKILIGLTATSSVVATLFFFQAENIFAFVFGEEWRTAGQYAKILVFSFLIRFIVSPLSVVFLIPGNVKYGTIWQIIYFLATLSVCLFYLPKGMDIFIIAFTINEVILYLAYLIMIFYALRK
ncbi:lipopolysaccharide biosynthesis protein [Domibacillus epiphyticus]|uniref:Polysaccharide biosynthesis protein n=1 Tax=Domibacillus epiphyticus TaxID=1714355 RepID=A0A1V2A6L4_9BACI|nr:oligosaccharide flippase family protein [Domibacillus epiphyticus]OMP66629.1 hypothetical protein BTO28_11340 [Domibacillus epiphyticus]